MDFIKHAKKTLSLEKQGIEAISNQIDNNFIKALEAANRAIENEGKIVISGVGKNWHISNKIAATLNSTGSPAAVLHPIEAMHGDFGLLQNSDVLIAISYSGASDEINSLVQLAKKRKIQIIALTANINSPLAHESDIILNISVPEEACPFNMAPTTSTTGTLALGDALAMALLESRDFKLEDYAKLHPGGAIGRSLLLSVKDIMRSNNKFANIQSGQPVKEAILKMTEAKSGSVAILNPQHKLIGILTDGDLRRHMINTPNLLEMPIDQIMTKDPITLSEDMLAIDVLKIYEMHNVDDLIVIDKHGTAIGSVDIQDIPKLKIM